MRRVSWLIVCVALASGCRPHRNPASVKLTMFGVGLSAGDLLREDALAEFTRRTGIEVDLIPTPGSSEEQLGVIHDVFARRATTPDVYLIDIVWLGALHEHLLDLTPHLTAEAREHLPALIASDTVAGRVISLPFYLNVGMLYYRADLLRHYGFKNPPATWAELRTMALRIQRGERERGMPSFWGYLWQGGAYEGLTCNALEWQASHGGGHIVNSDRLVSVNNTGTRRALETAAAWIGSISPRSVLAYSESDTLNVFRSGNAAFMRHWSSALPAVRLGNDGSVGIALLPSGSVGRAQSVGGFHLSVSRYSSHARQAAELVLYLSSKEVQRRRAVRHGYLPTYPDMLRESSLLRALPQAEVLARAAVDDWVVRPSAVSGPAYPRISKAYYQTVHRILSGAAPARSALPELEQELTRHVSEQTGPPRRD
jgi:trehalose/maltose transport system substrate-binding protein